MARNKYPEETLKKILDVSLKLFLEKGYDHTTVQDIVDQLGGLSKGAVYHHFKSKEDIYIAACEHLFSQDPTDGWGLVRDNPKLTAIEKMRGLILTSMGDQNEAVFRDIAVSQTKTPRFLVSRMLRSVEVMAPTYLQPILEQGVEEGSVQTDFPKELAEVLMLLMNIWMDAGTFSVSDGTFLRKMLFLLELCDKYGIKDIFNNEVSGSIESQLIQNYNQKIKERQV